MSLRGVFRVLILYDVADAIRLDQLRSILGAQPAGRTPSFAHPTPDYVRFEQPPVVESLGPIELPSGARIEGRIKYYDYGVASIEMEQAFDGEWESLVEQSGRWVSGADIEKLARDRVQGALRRAAPSLVKPYVTWLDEDYYIIQLQEIKGPGARPVTGAELLASHGEQIAQIVRGESAPLSDTERQEVLQSSISYYPTDLLVAGWTAAFVYDTVEGAAPTIQLLEYANTQLLEFRYYDNLLTRVLEGVYRTLSRGDGLLGRWRLAREAERLNTIRLEAIELAERVDNSIKFLSDMFYARLYRLVAAKVGVSDYRNLVDHKLRTAGELYEFMVDQFHHARAFILESAVVAILIIDLILLVRGKGV